MHVFATGNADFHDFYKILLKLRKVSEGVEEHEEK